MKIDFTKLKQDYKLIFICIPVIVFLVLMDSKNLMSTSLSKKIVSQEDIKGKLIISEIMTSNKGSYVDEFGKTYDWVEIYNGTDKDINLKDYGLSDSKSEKVKWLFPDITIKSSDYLVIFLSEIEKDGLYASFQLKKSGNETLTLRADTGSIIDSVLTMNIPKNQTMMRDDNGNWIVTDKITPGYENTEKGREEFVNSLYSSDKSVIVTEILPSNRGNYLVDGKLPSYIEITNISNDNINLKEFNVSNDINKPFLYRLPDKILKPNEVYLIYTDGVGEDNHASFELQGKEGNVYLSRKNKVVSSVEYKDLNNGVGVIYRDDNYIETTDISPGYLNNTNGKKEYLNSLKLPNELIINEVMNRNFKYLSQNGGKYYDWIELYNNTNGAINLSEYSLSKDKGDSSNKLPNITLNKGEYIVLMASGNSSLSNSSFKHLDFKLSNYEGLYLYHDKKLVDSLYVPSIPKGYSFGKGVSTGVYYYTNPTPKKENVKNGVIEISYAPIFSKVAGIYNNVDYVDVELKGSGKIYYTLDGSNPNEKSYLYTKPIRLKKTSTIKAISLVDSLAPSEVVTNSYIINENHVLPVLSITISKSSFDKLNNNPFADITQSAHAQLFESDGTFNIDCGMKVFGGESRGLPKKSYALKFKKEYGGNLKYKVFSNRDAYEYETLVLRSGSQDMNGSLFKDEFVTSLVDGQAKVDVQANKPIILYINNKYHGIYYIREKIDEEFITNHYDISSNKTNIMRIDYDVTAGSSKPLSDIVNYANSHDLSNNKNYEEISKKLDIDSFIDLWITQIYSNDYDIRNVRFFNNPYLDDGKVKAIAYDFDFAFEYYPDNFFNWMSTSGGMGYFKINNSLLINLLRNNNFKKRFIQRLAYSLNNIFTKEKVMEKYNYYYNLIGKEVKRDHKRWNISYDSWTSKCAQIKSFIEKRNELIKKQAKVFFQLSDNQMKRYFNE